MKKQHVLVVGGGFGGIKAALELADDERFAVTLITNNSHFRYYPTLYKTATGGKWANSRIPLDDIFGDKDVKIVMGEAVSLDRANRMVTLHDGRTYPYDTMVLSMGVVTNYFGIPGMEELSYSIKSHEAIARFKNHVHQQLIDEGKPDPHYVIVGAGPTGIELAGALPQYIRDTMAKHGIHHRAVHVDLIEAAPRLLPRFSKTTSRLITKRLKREGVRIYTGKAVQGLSADSLTVSGKPIRSHTVVWTAGVTNHPFFKDNGFAMNNRGKVETDWFLMAEPNIYVIGDNANTPYSGMAQTALYDGMYVARNLIRLADGRDPKGYAIKKPITVIPVGEHWAVVQWGSVRLYGLIGWILREAADYVAFKDYEPWWKAGRQWLTGFGREEECTVCVAAKQ
ncbi:MAG TPA: FAD-dependent oxidoreductase [Candidatus Saccharimonadales bacterium]|nr:FAD-dependent oxidoreductase [Candidatus Saccharimonadales bacterium]